MLHCSAGRSCLYCPWKKVPAMGFSACLPCRREPLVEVEVSRSSIVSRAAASSWTGRPRACGREKCRRFGADVRNRDHLQVARRQNDAVLALAAHLTPDSAPCEGETPMGIRIDFRPTDAPEIVQHYCCQRDRERFFDACCVLYLLLKQSQSILLAHAETPYPEHSTFLS